MAFRRTRAVAQKSQSSVITITAENNDSDDVLSGIASKNAGKCTSPLNLQKASAVKSKEQCDSEPMNSKGKSNPLRNSHEKMGDESVSAPEPRVIVGPHGYIILDESSVVIERTQKQKLREADIIYEGSKKRRIRHWTPKETKKFYRALSAVQTDFSLMAQIFRYDRSRHELKLKYKLEEKRNKALIDKALDGPPIYDLDKIWNDESDGDSTVEKNESEKIVSKCTTEVNEMNTMVNSSTKSTSCEPQKKKPKRKR